MSANYSSDNARSTLPDSVQYRFIWGDGSLSDWLPVGITSASHTWVNQGEFMVTVEARCNDNKQVISLRPPALTVTVAARP